MRVGQLCRLAVYFGEALKFATSVHLCLLTVSILSFPARRFDIRRGKSVPVIEGVVVCEQHAQSVMAAYWEDQRWVYHRAGAGFTQQGCCGGCGAGPGQQGLGRGTGLR